MPPETRDRIVFTALELFALKGYGSTSVADILGTAGVNAGSLYHFFEGKQDVLVAVLDTYAAGIRPMLLDPAWKGIADPIDRVFALLAGYRGRLLGSDCTYGCPIGSIALELHEPDPPVRERLSANFAAWVAAVERCFVEAGDRLPATVDRHALAVFALSTMEGGVMLSRTDRTVAGFDQAVASFRDYVERLLAESPVHPSPSRSC
jgi:TetR/AcrR family transcriptional regulator, transcriptional repressor for nem operon